MPGRPDEGGGGEPASTEDRLREEIGLAEGDSAPSDDGDRDVVGGPGTTATPPD